MRDEIVEVLVKCKTNIALRALGILLYILCAAAAVLAMLGYGLLGFTAAVIFGIMGYFATTNSQVEYEYTYCDKELDIDAIYSQSKRKHITTLELGKMEVLVRVEGSKMNEYARRQCATKDYSTKNKNTKDNVYALFYDGNVKVLIEPNERLLNAISYSSPRKVFKD